MSLFKPKRLKAAVVLLKEAKRRGISIDELTKQLTPEEIAALLPGHEPKAAAPSIDVTRWGLPDTKEVSTAKYIADPAVAAAEAAARDGDWLPAADLLTGIGDDWDQRAFAVRALAGAAADDDS